jgi:hypothetical protein
MIFSNPLVRQSADARNQYFGVLIAQAYAMLYDDFYRFDSANPDGDTRRALVGFTTGGPRKSCCRTNFDGRSPTSVGRHGNASLPAAAAAVPEAERRRTSR